MGADMLAWRELVSALRLTPHPEGGYYREVFRSARAVAYGGGQRAAATSIYYLLADGAYSAWHRIDADEVWYFHAGTELRLHVLSDEGELTTHRLGNPMAHPDTVLQAAVPAQCWFAAELADPRSFALLGCCVAPGFDFAGFQLATRTDMACAMKRHGRWVGGLLADARRYPAP